MGPKGEKKMDGSLSLLGFMGESRGRVVREGREGRRGQRDEEWSRDPQKVLLVLCLVFHPCVRYIPPRNNRSSARHESYLRNMSVFLSPGLLLVN